MSHVANAAALSNHTSLHKAAGAPEWQALTIKNIKGAQQKVRVAWLVQELRGLVAVVDVISIVRGLAHVDAARFFGEQKENWQRSQSRIAFTKLMGSSTSAESNRPAQDLEVCTLPDLSKVLDAMAAVQGQPAGADDVSSRLQRSVQDWARIRLEQRVKELSDDQANIKAALQSVFPAREPNKSTHSVSASTGFCADGSDSPASASASNAASADPPSANALAALSAHVSTHPVPSASSSRHSSPYIGPASGVAAPLSGNFWLYDPVASSKTPGAPSSGGTQAPGSNGSPRLVSQTMNQGSLLLSGQGQAGAQQTNGGGGSTLSVMCASTSLVSALSSGTGAVGGCGNAGQMAQSRKRPRESLCSSLPPQALNFNRIGGAELFRCTLCGIELANREDGSTIASDVAVAPCGHLYCTGCLTGAVVSGLPDEMYKCKRRRCGMAPLWYDRVRHGFATQRVEIFKGQPSENWLLPEKHRRFLAPEANGAKKEHRRGVVLTVSTRGVPDAVKTAGGMAVAMAPAPGPWSAPSSSTSPALARGPSPTLPPISAITGAPSSQQLWPPSPAAGAIAAPAVSYAQGLGLPALVSGSGGGSAASAGATGGAGVPVGVPRPRHESCILYAGQVPDDAANRMLRKLCAYFWFSLY